MRGLAVLPWTCLNSSLKCLSAQQTADMQPQQCGRGLQTRQGQQRSVHMAHTEPAALGVSYAYIAVVLVRQGVGWGVGKALCHTIAPLMLFESLDDHL